MYFNTTYAPPSTSGYTKNLDYDIFEKLEEEIIRYRTDGNVILGGDFNAKINIESDYVADQMDDHSPVNNIPSYNFDKPMIRQNSDKHPIDTHGQLLLNMCKNGQVRILNVHTRGDRTGKLTRFPLSLRETPSTIDYMIADTETLKNIKYFCVLPHLGLSDHECLSVSLKTGDFIADVTKVTIVKGRPIKYASADVFLMKLNSPLIQEKLRNFLQTYSTSLDSVEKMTEDIVDIINTSSIMTSSRTNKGNKKKKRGKKGKALWYSAECKKRKWSLNRAEKEFRQDRFNLKKKRGTILC